MADGKIAIPLSRLGSVHPGSVQELTPGQELLQNSGKHLALALQGSHLCQNLTFLAMCGGR